MARFLIALCVFAIARTATAGGGYGGEQTAPSPAPTAEPYEDPRPDPPPATEGYGDEAIAPEETAEPETMPEPEGYAPAEPMVYDAPMEAVDAVADAPEEAIDAAPVEEAIDTAPAEEAIDAAPTEDVAPMPMDDPVTADMPIEQPMLTEAVSYDAPVPMPNGGYRLRKKVVKRRFALKKASIADLRLTFVKNCSDKNKKCQAWAMATRARLADGRVVSVNECVTNRNMKKMTHCPRACGVCTPNIVEFNLRRRNAKILRARRLAKMNKTN